MIKAVFSICLVAFILVAGTVFGTISAEQRISSRGSILTISSDYTVAASSGTYMAMNSDGQTVASGTVASTVINTVFGMMGSGQKLALVGSFTITSTLTPAAGIYMDCKSATLTAQSNMDYMINIASVDVLTVDGGLWNGNGKTGVAIRGYRSNQITVKNGYFKNFHGSWACVIALNDGRFHLVENNTISHNPGCYAIVFNDGKDSKILRNKIYCDNEGSGIGVFSGTQGYDNNEIAYNTIYDWSDVLWHAIYVGGSPYASIHDNYMSAPQTNGGAILLKAPNCDVFNNHIYDCRNVGISLYWGEGGSPLDNPSGTKIFNNKLQKVGNMGIAISTRGYGGTTRDIDCFNNIIVDCDSGSSAITLWTETYPLENITLRSNTISNVSYAVRFGSWGAVVYASGTKILSNVFSEVKNSPVISIQSQTVTNTVIAYNDFNSAGVTSLANNGLNTMIYDNIGLQN